MTGAEERDGRAGAALEEAGAMVLDTELPECARSANIQI